jgi:hypothetical protein
MEQEILFYKRQVSRLNEAVAPIVLLNQKIHERRKQVGDFFYHFLLSYNVSYTPTTNSLKIVIM